MATHFYFNGHTFEIEPAKLTWDAASANAATLAWNDGDTRDGDDDNEYRAGNTVASYLTDIESSAELKAILKNLKASVEKGSTAAVDGGDIDHLWIGSTNTGLDLTGQLRSLSGSDLLFSIIEWDGLIGTAAGETLKGTNGDDIIDGNGGNDIIKSGSGNDIIYMGDGNDRVYTSNGNNTVYAETTDTDSDDGNDMVIAGSGDDFIAPGNGNDIAKAGNGNNTVIGGEGDDKITTGSGDDVIDSDGYYADDGVGGEGNDIISTGAGNDIIFLGNGFDSVTGGTGNDIFQFIAVPTGATAPVSSGSSGGGFSTGAASSTGSAGSTSGFLGSGTSSSSTPTVTTIKDINAGTNGSVVDQLVLDSAVFEALAVDVLPGGLTATNLLIGRGLTAPSANETGVDDYLIFNTKTGCLYYDADGNGTESDTVLVAVLKGKMTDFNLEDISIV